MRVEVQKKPSDDSGRLFVFVTELSRRYFAVYFTVFMYWISSTTLFE